MATTCPYFRFSFFFEHMCSDPFSMILISFKQDKPLACIFDMDGLLIDSESVYTAVTNEILANHGIEERLTWEIKSKVMGLPQGEANRVLIDHYKLPLTPAELAAVMAPLQSTMFSKVQPMSGALDLLVTLVKNKVPIALATSSRSSTYVYKTTHLPHLFSHFPPHAIVKGDDPRVKNGKPNPDIFIEAAKTLGLTTEEEWRRCIVFEDGIPGVEGAKKAGMKVVWVPDEGMKKALKEEDLGKVEGVDVLRSLKEWEPRKYGFNWDIEESSEIQSLKGE
ncbi:HAD-like protein [Atractiella rhizophila]|nr:HAD-like protein [Atractiella rhizophila]